MFGLAQCNEQLINYKDTSRKFINARDKSVFEDIIVCLL